MLLPPRRQEEPPEPMPPMPESTGSVVMRGLRVFGAGTAFVIMIVSVIAAIALGFQLYEWLQHPALLDNTVMQWEQLVRGKVDMNLPKIEQAANAATVSPKPLQPDVVQQMAGLMVISSRPFAIGLMLVLLGILARLLIVIFSTSANVLSALTADEAQIYQRLLREFRNRKN